MALRSARHRFETFPVLSSGGLILRRVVPSDASAVREISYYDGMAAATEDEAVAMLERIGQGYAAGDSVHWGICLRGSDEVVGTCGFYRGYRGNVGEIGYLLREAYRGRGAMTAALRKVIAFGLEAMRLDGIVARAERSNAASVGVLRRLGFREVRSGPEELTFSLGTLRSGSAGVRPAPTATPEGARTPWSSGRASGARAAR